MLARLRRRPAAAWWLGLSTTTVAAAVVVPAVDVSVLRRLGAVAVGEPLTLGLVLLVYAAAFGLRTVAWRRVLPGIGLGQAWAGIHLALAGNHVLPLRLGEPLRVTSAVRRAGVGFAEAAASTVALRAIDVAAVAALALLTGPAVVADLTGGWGWALLPLAALVAGLGIAWMRRLVDAGKARLRAVGWQVVTAATAAWVLEAAVIWQAASWAGIPLGPLDAVLVTAVTIAAQTFAVAPGGFGTYEAAATAALAVLGVPPGEGLAIALVAHGVKTAYALSTGALAAFVPSPGILGRVRLARMRRAHAPAAIPADAPVVLFMPAHDEEAAIPAVADRVPREVHGRPVRYLVIDDGSTDATAAHARAAGAEVIGLGRNHGLGAAVRRGLAEGVATGACAVVFCDADGEYAPEELERLVAPILEGRADYVVGSRFAGDIQRMLPHRRLGNVVLTRLLRFVARVPITDGQSGYRALSADAARSAEIIHDFNYAQVLTLDLLAKGYRYAEVPITYRFREVGTSFVRLGRYLREVVPAVWRELNREPAAGEPTAA